VLTAETKRRLDACRDILVGKLPLPTDQIELITLALIYKFMDDLDEESVKVGGKRSFFVGPLEKYRWRALLPQTVSADERMNLFAEGIETIGKAEHLPALFRDIFRNSFLKFRDGRILTLFLNEVNGFVYSHSEELGNAFEYLLKTMGIQAENGQFRTPRHIIDFMVACLDPQPNDRILDPACGTGGFLVSCYKHILAKHTSPGSTFAGDKLTHEQRQKVYANLTGYDVTDLMVKLSKVNLFLHGFPDPAIHIYDTLTNDARWNEKADLILANPPFMTPKGGVSPHTKFRVSAKKSEVLFTDYIAEHLTPEGRGGVIVPNGIVATTQNSYVKLRRFLVEDSLVAVVSLPTGVFKPYSGVKTSILLLDKKLARQTKKILFLKVTADGFDLGDQRREIADNDLPEAECVVKAWFKGKPDDATTSKVVWKGIERKTLLASKAVSLQAEQFLGVAVDKTSDHQVVQLGDICDDFMNGVNFGKEQVGRGVRFVNVKDVFSNGFIECDGLERVELTAHEIEKRLARPNDLLFVRSSVKRDGVGYTSMMPKYAEPVVFCGFIIKCTPRTSVVFPKYLFYLLRTPRLRNRIVELSSTAAITNISQENIKLVEIPLPPLEEQRRIVAEIEEYQKVLDGARKILAGYRPRFDANPDWELVPLAKLCVLVSGQHIDREDYNTDGRGMPYLTGPSDFGLISPKITRWTEAPKVTAVAGDVVVTVKGSGVGSVNLLDAKEIAISRQLMAVRAKGIDPRFLHAFLVGQQDYFQSLASGAAIPGITRGHVLSLEIPLPPLDEQRRIVAELDAEGLQIEAVRSLIPRFEAKIQHVLDRVWGNNGTQ
jgi:type I restriction enzyme M protein